VKRANTGDGETIDVSMTDVLASWTGAVPPLTLPDGQAVGGGVPGSGTFRSADGGWVALGVLSEDHLWAGLMTALELTDAASLSFPERLALTEALNDRVAEVIAARDRDELVAELAAAGVPASPVLSQPEMLAAEHFRRRGLVTQAGPEEPVVEHPLRYERHPARVASEVPALVEGPRRLPPWTAR
jgi:crotonobetainyl-CoA:carnitine CoA-transferase CaiB-like acyl-CoA transferase